MKWTIIVAAWILTASSLVILPGCGRGGDKARGAGDTDGSSAGIHGDAEGGTAAVRVETRAIEERTFEDVVTAPGQWKSVGEVLVSAPFAGFVDSLSARPGDRTRRGEVLCRLVTRESRAALRGAEILARQARDDAARDEAARAIELARREMVRVPITAPCDGVVTDVPVQPGSEITESAEILSIQTPEAIVFEARLDPSDARRVHVGEIALVVEREGVEGRAALVQRILPVANASDQTTLVWVAPRSTEGPPPEIDRFGIVTITAGRARRVVAVPDSAVVQDDLTGETRLAWIDARSRALWTPVTLGLGANGWHELKAPVIVPGTLVIVQGQRGLPDSTRVEPAP